MLVCPEMPRRMHGIGCTDIYLARYHRWGMDAMTKGCSGSMAVKYQKNTIIHSIYIHIYMYMYANPPSRFQFYTNNIH